MYVGSIVLHCSVSLYFYSSSQITFVKLSGLAMFFLAVCVCVCLKNFDMGELCVFRSNRSNCLSLKVRVCVCVCVWLPAISPEGETTFLTTLQKSNAPIQARHYLLCVSVSSKEMQMHFIGLNRCKNSICTHAAALHALINPGLNAAVSRLHNVSCSCM